MQRLPPHLLICLFLSGCAATATGPGRPRMHDGVSAKLIFGRGIGPVQGVGEQARRRFVDEEVTPRLPDGFTAPDGNGQ